jgi:hypothetical protein
VAQRHGGTLRSHAGHGPFAAVGARRRRLQDDGPLRDRERVSAPRAGRAVARHGDHRGREVLRQGRRACFSTPARTLPNASNAATWPASPQEKRRRSLPRGERQARLPYQRPFSELRSPETSATTRRRASSRSISPCAMCSRSVLGGGIVLTNRSTCAARASSPCHRSISAVARQSLTTSPRVAMSVLLPSSGIRRPA